MPRRCALQARDFPPSAEGLRPRIVALAWSLAALAGVAGCEGGAGDQVLPPVDLGMTGKTAPFYDDGNTTLYEVQLPVALPVRAMTAADVRAAGRAPRGTPYPRGVFLRADDESLEAHVTITNLDGSPHDVWLLVDPWNEFVRWRPGVTVVSDDETVPNFGYDLLFHVPSRERVETTLTTDDMHEIAIKLASIEALLASPPSPSAVADGSAPDPTSVADNIFDPQNRSNSGDPLYTPWIPPVVAGLTGFDLGLRTSDPANVAVEVVLDVQDLRGDRFVADDDRTARRLGPPPVVLSPPGARF